MQGLWRVLTLMALALPLASCGNTIVTLKPLFDASRDTPELHLRDGWWASTPKCRPAVPGGPIGPDCHPPYLVKGNAITLVVADGSESERDPALLIPLSYITVKQTPLVAQLRLDLPPGASPGDKAGTTYYNYLGLRDLKRDEQGRVIAVTMWPALCGPPPPDPRPVGASEHEMSVPTTLRPFPGVRLENKADGCSAASPATITTSLKASSKWRTLGPDDEYYWVPGDFPMPAHVRSLAAGDSR